MNDQYIAADAIMMRRPFEAAAVEFLPATSKPAKDGSIRCITFISHVLVRERLGRVDPAWAATYRPLAATGADPIGGGQYYPIECALTIKNVTRVGVGQASSASASDTVIKAAHSDALKRAGLEYGVGAYLRALPTLKIGANDYWTKGNDRVGGLKVSGVKALRAKYTQWLDHREFRSVWGAPTEAGVLPDDLRSVVDETDPDVGARNPIKVARVVGG